MLPSAATLEEALDLFASTPVHMAVLTETGRVGDLLLGTLVRGDLPAARVRLPAAVPALGWARLVGRTMHADLPAEWALRLLRAGGRRRAAVVGDEGRLLGLLCVKRNGLGFCSADDVRARRRDRKPGIGARASTVEPLPSRER